MTQRSYELQFTHQELTNILENMLKIPKSHKPLHPSQQRSKYANLLDWLVSAMTSMQKQKQISPKELAQQQQQLITSSLDEMIELTRKQCLQKSMVLEMVQQYLISTLNSYWKVFQNASKEISYEYEHNSVKIEKQYISEIKRLQAENEELKKDKEHRWRNMFMLIKDNRIYRKKNKKLVKTIHYELEKGRLMAEQMISQQFQNQKIKAKLDYLEQETFNLQNYMEMTIKLVELQKKVKQYPNRCKKMLKNDLINVEISQIKNLHDKINFIIKAVQETGEIIDQIYDEDVVFSNFHYNISTQTDENTEDKGVNTTQVRLVSTETQTYNREHIVLAQCDTLQLRVKGLKAQKKENGNRDSKNVMFISQSLSRLVQPKKQEAVKSGKVSKRGDNIQYFSICEAIKITIYQARISYISTYNTEIFNGLEVAKHVQENKQKQVKQILPISVEIEIQTDPAPTVEESLMNSFSGFNRSINKKQSKLNLLQAVMFENKKQQALKMERFQVCKEVTYFFDPNRLNRSKQQIKMRITRNFEKQNIKQIDSEKWLEGQRQSLRLDKQTIKESPVLSKVTIKKTTIKQQLKRSKMLQEQQKNQALNFIKPSDQKKLQSISVQTQNNTLGKLNIKNIQEFTKERPSQLHSKSPTSKAIESVLSEISQGSTIVDLKTQKKEMKIKQFNKSLNSINTSKVSTPKESRNKSSVVSLQQLKSLQFPRNSKFKEGQHKRTITQTSELASIPQQTKLAKISQIFKAKVLHRISEDIHEVDHFGQQKRGDFQLRNKEKAVMPLPFLVSKEGDLVLKDMDFSKGLQKILKNMDMRRNEILNNHHTLKSYLVSYFKCLYGRQIYPNFINFLINSSDQGSQQLIVCFNKLTNSKLPEPYLVDIFRTFIIMLNKCYLINQSPTSDRIRLDLLTSMINLYFDEQESKRFVLKMNRLNIHNFCGWFICFEDQLKSKVIFSELHHFLNQILIQSEDSISYNFIEQLTYFIPNEELHFKNLIRSKTLLSKKTAIHRWVLFCIRYKWRKMIQIQHTIQTEYLKLLGLFDEDKSIHKIQNNMPILAQFKNLSRCVKYWLLMKGKYGSRINGHLLMLCQLVILQYRMKVDFPISRELRFINLAYEGLQKKLFHEQLREGLQEQDANRNYSLY